MDERTSRWSPPLVRGIAVLGVLLIAAGALSPAFGAQGVTKKKAKKIAKKQATNQINALVPGLINSGINAQVPGLINAATVEQGTIPATTMSTSDANKTIFTRGPFTLLLDCSEVAGPVAQWRILARTSELNSFADGSNWYQELDPSDGDVELASLSGNAPGGESYGGDSGYFTEIWLKSPSGTNVRVVLSPVTNYMGNHCYVDGFFIALA